MWLHQNKVQRFHCVGIATLGALRGIKEERLSNWDDVVVSWMTVRWILKRFT